jgi:nucleotide-binding universal stress UspA family protein
MATPDEPAKERIVVAVDASAASLLALELAADLAAALGTRLAGLYVEEEELLHAAGLPFGRLVRAQSGKLAPFTADELERQWRALATEARAALTRAAQARHIACSFEVVRGRAAQVMAEATRGARLASLGSGARGARIGSVARAALAATDASLLLVPPRRRGGVRWLALLDTPGTAPAVLAMASALGAAGAASAPLLALTPALENALPAGAGPAPGAALSRQPLSENAQLPELFALLHAQRGQGLILGADSPFAAPSTIEALLADGWPLLLVR